MVARLVIAGTHSGVGKTTVATGLMAAFRARGRRVGAAKVGPDYIDPGYHALATGRPGRNLDAWMCGAEAIVPLAARAGSGCDLLIVEGVMGLFDGAGATPEASTAHVARLLSAPVVLVVDASAMSGSVAALVHGYATYDREVRVAGVVLNQVGSDAHAALLREALAPLGVPVLGVLRRDDAFAWRDRHLGLVPVIEDPELVGTRLAVLAARVDAACDLAALEALARTAPPLRAESPCTPEAATGRETVPIAVAAGRAFSFMYADNLELLEAAGAEVVPFDPLADRTLPEGVQGLIAGGGFPEVYADHLADNRELLADVRARVGAGLVTWAECGGLLWLCRSLDGRPMAGVIAADGTMTERLTLGYREAVVARSSPLGTRGAAARGHEFHYSTVSPGGDGVRMRGRGGSWTAGFAGPTLLASYLHVHLAGQPALASAFVAAAGGVRPHHAGTFGSAPQRPGGGHSEG